jgi:hypothetical protein
MRTLALLVLMAVLAHSMFPAHAQGTTCATTISDLRDAVTRGDWARVRIDYAKHCPGLNFRDLEDIEGAICPNGGFIDHINSKLRCF